MNTYGLIGFPLSHSFSVKYFSEKFVREGIVNCNYINFPIPDIGILPRLIAENESLKGLNVTIPYKEQVIPYLDETDRIISSVRAVNTIKISRQGDHVLLKGYNTDVYGFETSLKPWLKGNNRHALILGTGGASKAVAYVLRSLGFDITYVSRKPGNADQISYAQVTPEIILRSGVIVNGSPVGMYPDVTSCPALPYEFLTPSHVLYDLIYNPHETLFLKKGRERGAVTINGQLMLQLQAEKSWEIWNEE